MSAKSCDSFPQVALDLSASPFLSSAETAWLARNVAEASSEVDAKQQVRGRLRHIRKGVGVGAGVGTGSGSSEVDAKR